jgi:hypothetical protein
MPQSSVTVQVFVYVPLHGVPSKAPEVFSRVKLVLQLSVAKGTNAYAAASPATSLHSSCLSKEPTGVVHIGAV